MKKLIFIAATSAAIVFNSCDSAVDNTTDSNERVAVQFASSEASIQTRVGSDGFWETNDPVGIFMYDAAETLSSASIKENADNIRYKAEATGAGTLSTSFAADGTTIYYPVSGSVKFIAYYPYTATANLNNFVRTIDLSSQANQATLDVLYAATTSSYDKTSGTVTLPFAHKLVKLVFAISNGAGVTESLANGLTVKITDQQTAGAIDLTTGAVTTSGATADLTILNGSGNSTAEAIVFAQTTSGKKFTFTNAAGETFTGAIPDTWEAGKKYTYTVTLKKNAVSISGTITDWITGGNSTVDAE